MVAHGEPSVAASTRYKLLARALVDPVRDGVYARRRSVRVPVHHRGGDRGPHGRAVDGRGRVDAVDVPGLLHRLGRGRLRAVPALVCHERSGSRAVPPVRPAVQRYTERYARRGSLSTERGWRGAVDPAPYGVTRRHDSYQRTPRRSSRWTIHR